MKLLETLLTVLEGQRDDRIAFLKNQLSLKWHGMAGIKDLDSFLNLVSEADPSDKGVYMQWISRIVIKDPEEVKKLKQVSRALSNFERFKGRIEKNDINQYKTFDELIGAMSHWDSLHDIKAQGGDTGALEELMKKYNAQDPSTARHKAFEELVKKASKADPSDDGRYVAWIVKLIMSKPHENKIEDLPRLHDDLVSLEKYQTKVKTSIDSLKSFQDVYRAIAPHLNKDEKAALDERMMSEKIKHEITVVYDGPEGWIRIPNTVAAAKFLGQSTRWCTAARDNNMFNHYNTTDKLFVVYDKATKARFQLHIQTGQFADDTDSNKGVEKTPHWARKPIYQWYKKNNPKYTLQQLFTLTSFVKDENIASGTPHEGLLDLMKQYNII